MGIIIGFCPVRVAQSLAFCGSLFVWFFSFLLTIVLSVLQSTASDYPLVFSDYPLVSSIFSYLYNAEEKTYYQMHTS
jgi:hypothetical protein